MFVHGQRQDARRGPEHGDDRQTGTGEVLVRPNFLLVTGLFLVIAALAAVWLATDSTNAWTIYGAAVGLLLAAKLALSLAPPRRWHAAHPETGVCVVVPMFNEDPATLSECLASIARQTHVPHHVRIIDDGSTGPQAAEAHQVAREWARRRHARLSVQVIHQPNAGKREAMAVAFRELADHVDVFLCVDSDTVLESDAIRRGLAPFTDPTVAAATGTVVALNHAAGLLPRLLDLRYVNAFLYERAAYSRLGSVLCVCGSLAFWRADIVRAHLDDFLGQTFLGQPATYGDDRHLTNLSLLHGKVVLVRDSVASTAVPERGSHLVRQQIRWGRSFFRESLWSLRNLSPRRPAWWLAVVESVSWAGFTIGLVAATLVLPLITGDTHVLDYLVWVTLAGYARSVHVFSVQRPGYPWWQQAGVFALAPLYGMIHMLVLLPLRVWSLLTLRDNGWGTRAGGVEVAMQAPQPEVSVPAVAIPAVRIPQPRRASPGPAPRAYGRHALVEDPTLRLPRVLVSN